MNTQPVSKVCGITPPACRRATRGATRFVSATTYGVSSLLGPSDAAVSSNLFKSQKWLYVLGGRHAPALHKTTGKVVSRQQRGEPESFCTGTSDD